MTDPTTPTTEAGRQMLTGLPYLRQEILAIEAQARADEQRRLAGLVDIARVKQAVTNIAIRHGVVKDPPQPTWSLMHMYGYTAAPAVMDGEIAAEYRALSETEPAP